MLKNKQKQEDKIPKWKDSSNKIMNKKKMEKIFTVYDKDKLTNKLHLSFLRDNQNQKMGDHNGDITSDVSLVIGINSMTIPVTL